jgi:uncharacterized membrane protein
MDRAEGPEIGTRRVWIGKIFLVLALAWFGGVFYLMRPDLPHVVPRPTPVITLPDGTTHKVYLPSEILGAEANWVEGVDIKTQYTSWDFMHRPMIRFLIIAVGPIFTALVGAFLWLAIAEWRVRRRYPSTYDSLF